MTYSIPILLENQHISINGHINNLNKLEIVGSQATEDYNNYIEKFNPLYVEVEDMVAEINRLTLQMAKAKNTNDSIILQELMDKDSALRKLKVFHPKRI